MRRERRGKTRKERAGGRKDLKEFGKEPSRKRAEREQEQMLSCMSETKNM